jgi:GR25 family glycosyltransferase involved in LPS biosynthesis
MATFDLECHVINLARTPERLTAFLKQNAKSGLPFQRFEAADGNALSEDDAVRLRLIKPGTKWRTKGTIGVALSHRNLWERAIAEGRPLMVFEDDAFVREDAAEVFAAAIAKAGDWDIILLGYNTDALVEFNVGADFGFSALPTIRHPTQAQLEKFVRSREPANLFRLRHAFGISAYAVSPAGARKLVLRCFPMDNRPIVFKAANNRFNVFSLDGMMNACYGDIAAYAFVAPLALPHNDWEASTVDARKR